MSLLKARSAAPVAAPKPTAPPPVAADAVSGPPFFGALDAVLVADKANFEFEGAIARAHAAGAWTWLVRDVAPDLLAGLATRAAPEAAAGLEAVLGEVLQRARAAAAEGKAARDAERRLIGQLGGEETWERLPFVLDALRCVPLLGKAQGFGRAVNGLADDAALGSALQSMPLADPVVMALLMQAAVGQVTNPGRLVAAAVKIAGSASEAALQRAGFGPLIDALLAHAQDQLPTLSLVGPFADIDRTCRCIERFHRLMRAVHGYVELNRTGRWAMVAGALTKAVSERIEPRLRDVAPDVNMALRRRDSGDRFDPDLLLSALNGVYVLAAVREARDSLALNALFDQTWAQVGQSLEAHIKRNLEVLRQAPGDEPTSERLDAAIKMAGLRFSADYAEVLRRAKETAEKRG